MQRLLATLFVFVTVAATAQDIAMTGIDSLQGEDSIRAYYIRHYPDYFFLYPVLKQRRLTFEFEKETADGTLITYEPNNAYSFGVGAYLFELGFELAFAIPLDEKSLNRYGVSRARDVQLNVLGKKFGVDAFFQRYRGFYVTDSNVEVPDDMPYPQRRDIVSRNFGVTGNYTFNHNKFSFRSAYNFAEHQVFSKGSMVVFATLSSFRMNADSSVLNASQRAIFGEDLAFQNLKYATFSIAPGYTYSLVFNNFFLNGTLSIGPAHHWIGFQTDSGEGHDTAINSFVVARLAMGYNGDRLFGGISFLSQGSNVQFEDARFGNSNSSFKILFGYRFREKGMLKKRIWDLVPIPI